jgi:hypothetical protein
LEYNIDIIFLDSYGEFQFPLELCKYV